MITFLSLFLSAGAIAPSEPDHHSLVCNVELVLRIESRNGEFAQVEERPQLSYLITEFGVSPYMYNGESIFKEENSLGLRCSKYPNGSTLCEGDSTFGQTVMTSRFELRPDRTFFFHEIGSTSSDRGFEQAAIDKITVGQCSERMG